MANANRLSSRCLRLVVIENGADGLGGDLPSDEAQETVMIAGAGYDLTTHAIRRLDALARQGRWVCGVVVAIAGDRSEQAAAARAALVRSMMTRMSENKGGTVSVLLSHDTHPALRSQVLKLVDTLLAEVRQPNVQLRIRLDDRRSISPAQFRAAG